MHLTPSDKPVMYVWEANEITEEDRKRVCMTPKQDTENDKMGIKNVLVLSACITHKAPLLRLKSGLHASRKSVFRFGVKIRRKPIFEHNCRPHLYNHYKD